MDIKSEKDNSFFGRRAWLLEYPRHLDQRGCLEAFDFDWMPFTPCRSFIITDVPPGTIRGRHMHRSGMQMLVCLNGRIEILMRYHGEERRLLLDPDSPALVFRSGVWCQQRYVEENSILLAFASEPYTPDSYVDYWNPGNPAEVLNRCAGLAPGYVCDD